MWHSEYTSILVDLLADFTSLLFKKSLFFILWNWNGSLGRAGGSTLGNDGDIKKRYQSFLGGQKKWTIAPERTLMSLKKFSNFTQRQFNPLSSCTILGPLCGLLALPAVWVTFQCLLSAFPKLYNTCVCMCISIYIYNICIYVHSIYTYNIYNIHCTLYYLYRKHYICKIICVYIHTCTSINRNRLQTHPIQLYIIG